MVELSGLELCRITLCVLLITAGVTSAQHLARSLGNFSEETCRGMTVNITWNSPMNAFSMQSEIRLTVVSKPKAGNPEQMEIPILEKEANKGFVFPVGGAPYKGRLFNISFVRYTLTDVQPSDSGIYRLEINGTSGAYSGTFDLTVFSEENIWPRTVSIHDQSRHQAPKAPPPQSPPALEASKTYTFERHDVSPATSVRMYAKDGEGRTSGVKECTFDGNSRCDVVFDPTDFQDLQGVVQMVVLPKLRPGTPLCVHDHKITYSLLLVIPTSGGLSTGSVVAIVVVALILVALIVAVPQIVIKYKDTQKRLIPLTEGAMFVRYCVGVIESKGAVDDIQGIYVTQKPKSQIEQFFEVYRSSKGQPEEDYSREKTLLSLALITFLTREKSPWLPIDFQQNISKGITDDFLREDLTFDTEKVKSVLSDTSSKLKQSRYDVIQEVILHLKRLSEILANYSDSAGKFPEITDIIEIFCGALFKESLKQTIQGQKPRGKIEEISMFSTEWHQKSQAQQRFLELLVENANEVFSSESN